MTPPPLFYGCTAGTRAPANVVACVERNRYNPTCREPIRLAAEVTAMSKMMTVAEIVKENEEAMERGAKRATRSKRAARAFLIRAGILNKSGKGLAKPYR
jgi:hypothetical protein